MRQSTKKIMALLLSVLMVVTIIPFGTIGTSATSESGLVKIESDVDTDYGLLGWTFDALSEDPLDDQTDLTATSIFDYSKIDAYVMGDANQGVISQGANVEFASSAKEMMQKLGIETSSSAKGTVGISKAKAGFESKFSVELDYTTESKVEELFYYYVYRAICENYRLKTASNYSDYLSTDFIAVINKVEPNNPSSIKKFFDTYGTHVLIQYDKGAQMSLSASAVSESTEVSLKESLSSSISASASAEGKASVEAANQFAIAFDNQSKNTSVKAQMKWHMDGGDTAYLSNFSGESITVNEQGVENWIASIKGNTVFLPETSKWVAIWEVIPNTAEYAVLREALYNYYLEQEITPNTDFFSQYISYSEFTNGTTATYVNPNGYVSFVTYKANMQVAPGSVITVPVTDAENYELIEYKVTLGNAEVDRNGVIQIKSNATDKVIIQIYGDYLPIATLSFVIMPEGDGGRFSGGYGDIERPFLISSATDLTNIRDYATAKIHFIQTNDINLNGGIWAPIPTFSATYDGNGFSISNFNITGANDHKSGFVSVNAGIIRNLTVSNSKIQYATNEDGSQTKACVGAIAGENQNTIESCSVNNTKIYGELNDRDNNAHASCYVGGIVGVQGINGKMSYCSVEGCDIDVYMGAAADSGDNNYGAAGGAIGACDGVVEHTVCKFNDIYSKVLGDGKFNNKAYPEPSAGGISGTASGTAKINNCIAYSNIVGTCSTEGGKYTKPTHYKGEVVGYLYGSMSDCYCNVDGNLVHVLDGGTKTNVIFINNNDFPSVLQNKKTWMFDLNGVPALNLPSSVVIEDGLKTEYVLGDTLDLSTLFVKTFGHHDVQYETPQIKMETSLDVMNDVGKKEIRLLVGSLSATFWVDVLPITLQKIEIKQQLAQTEYYVGDTSLNKAGLHVEAIYNNGDRKDVTDKIAVTGFNASVATENQVITFNYAEENVNHTVSQNIKIFNVMPFKIEMETLPNKINYAEGERFDATGAAIKIYYNNGTTQTTSQNLSYSGFESNVTGTQTITVVYSDNSAAGDLSTTFEVNVGTIRSIAIKSAPTKLQYYVGDSKKGVDTTGLILTATYSNGVTVDISSGYTVSNLNASAANTWETVTVSLFGQQTTFQVYINAVELVSIEIDRLPQTQYLVGDTFSSVGLRVKAIYNNGDVKLKQGTDCELLVGNIDANKYTFTSTGVKTVNVDYYENNKSATATFDINAVAVKLDRLEIAHQPTKILYKAGESIETAGMLVNAIYNNGDIVNITNSIDAIVCDLSTVGNKEAVVWYNNLSTSFEVTVMSPSHISVTSLPSKTIYNYGECFDYTGMVVTAYYPDGSQKQLDSSEYEINTIQGGMDGNVAVNVDYLDRTDSFYLTILMPTIDVDIVSACAGKTVSVDISIDNNPGILGATFTLDFDDRLTLLSANNGDALSTLSYTAPGVLSNPCSFGWDGIDVADTSNGVMLTLTFLVPDDAEIGDSYAISVSYDEGSIFDDKMSALGIDIINGSIEILDYTAGDLNNDGVINMQDVVLLRRYIVGGYDVDINVMAADVNRDNAINMQDVVLIRRYIVGGYDVELQ